MNERGSSLLVVLLVTLIFSVLGLSVLGAAVNNTKLTAIREQEIETTASGKVLMSEVLAKLQENLNPDVTANLYAKNLKDILIKNDTPPGTHIYDIELDSIISETEKYFDDNPDLKGFTVNINELDLASTDPKIVTYKTYGITEPNFKEKNYIRIFEITIDSTEAGTDNPNIPRTVSQIVILSPTPSFLNYAVGAYGKLHEPVEDRDKDIASPNSALVINGSPDIIGDIFAPTLELNSRAVYRNIDPSDPTGTTSIELITGPFHGPSVFGTLYTENINNKRESNPTKARFFEGKYAEVASGITGIPVIKPISKNFVDMDFNSTRNLKWTDTGLPDFINDSTTIEPFITKCKSNDNYNYKLFEALINTDGLIENNHSATGSIGDLLVIAEGDEEIRNGDTDDSSKKRAQNPKFFCGNDFGKDHNKQVFLIEESMLETYKRSNSKLYSSEDIDGTTSTLFFTNIDKDSYHKHIFKDDHVLTLNQDLNLKDGDEKGWLVVNGNLEINGGTEDNPIVIKGNILVNGNLFIKSSGENKEFLEFDATVYVTGNSTIDNVNIDGAKENESDPDKERKQLVLISNKDLKIVRINEYEEVLNPTDNKLVNLINDKPNLKAFFYTDSNATLYGVGSHFQIEGGVFARQQLTINAIRYNFSTDSLGAISEISSATDYASDPDARSRFYVEYDTRVITDQLNSLPRVDRLQMIVDDLNIQ
ncbi:hypothetical protein P9265_15850 [Schinkia azotoformans]|uniref:hypothetical protein n=1 Tax=Schinkia azotoformans TaxID=1454 RepID=UPI002E1F7576|nr:hypothetical protein [Schinkia azotoformans]